MESRFQFTNPTLIELEFVLNDDFDFDKEMKVDISLDLHPSIKRLTSNEAEVTLSVKIGKKEEDAPFYLLAKETAKFKWDDALDEKRVTHLLKQNAPSLLLSYIRPIIVQVTSFSPMGAYHIPFINFTNQQ